MFNLLGAENNNNVGSIILLVVLGVMLVGYLVFGMRARKKSQEKAMQMLNDLKIGDKVVTNAGIYGEIVSIKETNMGKVVTIKTGDEETKKTSFLTINASVILGIDEKKDLVLDKDGNVIDDEESKEELKKEVLKENAEKEAPSKNKEEDKKESAAEENEIINKVKKKSAKK